MIVVGPSVVVCVLCLCVVVVVKMLMMLRMMVSRRWEICFAPVVAVNTRGLFEFGEQVEVVLCVATSGVRGC